MANTEHKTNHDNQGWPCRHRKEIDKMNTKELLTEAHRYLDAATDENKGGWEAMCMYNLGALHGLLICFIEQVKKEPPKRRSSTND